MKNKGFELLTEGYEAEIESVGKPIQEIPYNPVQTAEFEKLKACAGKEKTQTPNLFLYLTKIFNADQLCDFYWLVFNFQTEYGAFMTNENNMAFGKIYNKSLDDLKKKKITFGVWKDTINNELNKRVLPENEEV